MSELEDLQKQYKKLAKRIDERMRQLERRESTRYAYQVAQRAAKSLFGTSRPRFERKVEGGVRELRSAINKLQEIEALPSSTATGLKSIRKQAVDTLNAHYEGLDLQRKELGSFFESGAYKELLAHGYSSDTIVRGIAKMKQDKKAIQRAINNHTEYHVSDSYGNVNVANFIFDQVNKNGFSYEDFFDGFGMS